MANVMIFRSQVVLLRINEGERFTNTKRNEEENTFFREKGSK
jgi:hypothetical protein